MDTMSASEAASLLHLNVKRVQGLARAGKLPASRVGRKWLFHRRELEQLLRPSGRSEPGPGSAIELSARNRLRGRILEVRVDGLMAEVRLDVGGQELVSVITRASAERLNLVVGSEVYAVIKSTEIMIGRSGS